MFCSRSFFIAAVVAPLLAHAQSKPNPFTLPPTFSATAGENVNLTWTPTTDGPVSIVLRQGNSGDLTTVATIAPSIDNSGSFIWMVPKDAVRGADYALEIVSGPDDGTDTNYSGPFSLDSDNVSAPSSSGSATASQTDSASSSLLTPSAFPSPTWLTIETTPYHSTTASMTSTSDTGSSSPTSSTASMTSTAPETSTDSPDLQASQTSTTPNAAPRATVMAGMLGAVALGALAL